MDIDRLSQIELHDPLDNTAGRTGLLSNHHNRSTTLIMHDPRYSLNYLYWKNKSCACTQDAGTDTGVFSVSGKLTR